MLKEIALLFTRLGIFGFGGPIAVIAMMEEEFSKKRRWLSPERFNEIYAVCKVLPGTVAGQMAILVGRERGGTWGGLIAGLCYILPSFVIVMILSAAYMSSGALQHSARLFVGFQAAALAVILMSAVHLSKPYRRKIGAWLACLATVAVTWAKPSLEPVMIAGAGLFAAWRAKSATQSANQSVLSAFGVSGALLAQSGQATALGLSAVRENIFLKLFWTCFKGGAFVFGTGLAIVPILEHDVIQNGWMTRAQFMDGLAIGQVTPGPVLITSTFIGYVSAGTLGALVTTFAIFVPGFINALFIVPRIWRRISGTPEATAFASAAIPAVIGGILATTGKLGVATLRDPLSVSLFLICLAIALSRKLPSWILILTAGAVGAIAS